MTTFDKDQEIEYAKMDLKELENLERNMIEENNYMQALKVDKLLDKFRAEITTFIDNYVNSAKQGSKSFVRSEEMFRKMLDIYSLCAHDLIIQLNKLNLYTLSGILQKVIFGMKLFATGLMKFQIEFISSYSKNFENEFLRTHATQVTTNPNLKVQRASTMSFNDMKNSNTSVNKNLDQNVVFSVTSNIDAISALLNESNSSSIEPLPTKTIAEERKLLSEVIEREISKEMEEQNKILEQMDSLLGAKREQDRASYSGLSQELRGILRGKKGQLIEESEEAVIAKKKKKEKIIYEEDGEDEDYIPSDLRAPGNEDQLRKYIEMRQKRWRVETRDISTQPDPEIFDINVIKDLKDHIEELNDKLSEMVVENQILVSNMNNYLDEIARYKIREYEMFKAGEDQKKNLTDLKVSESELDFTLNQLRKEANTLKVDIGHMENKLEKSQDKKRKYKHERIQMKNQLEEALKERDLMKDSENMFQDIKKKYHELLSEASAKNEKLKTIQEAYEFAKEAAEENEEKFEKAKYRISDLESQLAELNREKEEIKTQSENIKKEVRRENLRDDLMITKKELENMKFSNDRIKAENKVLEKEKTSLKIELETSKRSNDILKENLEKIKTDKGGLTNPRESKAFHKNSVATQQDLKKNSVAPSPKSIIGSNNLNFTSELDQYSSQEGNMTPRTAMNKKLSINTDSPKSSSSKILAANTPSNFKSASILSPTYIKSMSKIVSNEILEDESEKSDDEDLPIRGDNSTQTDIEQDFESTLEKFLISNKMEPGLSKQVLKYIKEIKLQAIKGEQNKFNAAKQFEDLLGYTSTHKRSHDGNGNHSNSVSTIAEITDNPLMLYTGEKGSKKPSFTKSEIKNLITPSKGASLSSLANLVSPSKGLNEGFKLNMTYMGGTNPIGSKKNFKNNSIDQSNFSSVASLDADPISVEYRRGGERKRKEIQSPTNITQILMNSDEESTEEEKEELIKAMFESFESRVTEKKNNNKDVKKLVDYIKRSDGDSEMPSFHDFKNYVVRLFQVHKKCGKDCSHLRRFYQKIGYQHTNLQQGILSRRKTLALTKTEITPVPLTRSMIARLPEISSFQFRKPENRQKKLLYL